MRCFIGQHIKLQGWNNWNKPENEKTARYAEYKNHGPSANPLKRVNWARQLTDEEAKELTLSIFFGDWFIQDKTK